LLRQSKFLKLRKVMRLPSMLPVAMRATSSAQVRSLVGGIRRHQSSSAPKASANALEPKTVRPCHRLAAAARLIAAQSSTLAGNLIPERDSAPRSRQHEHARQQNAGEARNIRSARYHPTALCQQLPVKLPQVAALTAGGAASYGFL
jgi:hypothetical protein